MGDLPRSFNDPQQLPLIQRPELLTSLRYIFDSLHQLERLKCERGHNGIPFFDDQVLWTVRKCIRYLYNIKRGSKVLPEAC